MQTESDILSRVQSRVGEKLSGKWRLERLLGVGGMAAVYEAVHRNRNRVAVKMLHPHLSSEPELQARFLREGYVANTVDHPGAVRVFDDDIAADGSAFLVMELLEGETLDTRQERQGALPLHQVVAIARELLDVLIAAHGHGIIHRDLKPENLFVTVDGRLKVLDFGIARLREGDSGTRITAIGTCLGTPSFMAPEQARGHWHKVDVRSDIWATGATLFNLATGRTVRTGSTINEQLVQAATEPPPSVESLLPGIHPDLREVIDRALAFDPDTRWPSAREMARAVEAVAKAMGGVPPLAAAPPAEPSAAPTEATVAASPKKLAEITGDRSSDASQAPPNATVSHPAVAATQTGTSPGRSPSRWLVIGTAAAVAVAVGVLLLLAPRQPQDGEAVAAENSAPAAAAPTPCASPPMVTSAEPEVLPDPSASAAPPPKPSVTPPRPAATRRPPAPRPATTTTAAPQPPGTRPPARNPFDKRF